MSFLKILNKNQTHHFSEHNNSITPKQIMIGLDADHFFTDFIFFKKSIVKTCINNDFFIYAREFFIGIHWSNESSLINIQVHCQKINNLIDDLFSNQLKVVNRRNYSIKTNNRQQYKNIHKVICYSPEEVNRFRTTINYFENNLGEIYHILTADSYKNIVDQLLTLKEIAQYLHFRLICIKKMGLKLKGTTEQKLIDEYLTGEYGELFSKKSADNDSSVIINHLARKEILENLYNTTYAQFSNEHRKFDYYGILSKLANLSLLEVKQFRDKYFESKNIVENDLFSLQYDSEKTDIGLVYIRHKFVEKNFEIHEKKYNLILNGYQYQHRFPTCIAILFYSFYDRDNKISNGIRWWVHYTPGEIIYN